ncbi:MAG TPA: hypothetical protein DD670_19120 [Planctomycetaceae bacterium]|nr:hypothetical protein [Planctomycetaceae bacterium]
MGCPRGFLEEMLAFYGSIWKNDKLSDIHTAAFPSLSKRGVAEPRIRAAVSHNHAVAFDVASSNWSV